MKTASPHSPTLTPKHLKPKLVEVGCGMASIAWRYGDWVMGGSVR